VEVLSQRRQQLEAEITAHEERIRQLLDQLEIKVSPSHYIRRYPLLSVGGALALGYYLSAGAPSPKARKREGVRRRESFSGWATGIARQSLRGVFGKQIARIVNSALEGFEGTPQGGGRGRGRPF